MGETLGEGVGYERVSYNGISYGIGYGKIGISTLGDLLEKVGGRDIGSSDVCSGGSGDGNLEGYIL